MVQYDAFDRQLGRYADHIIRLRWWIVLAAIAPSVLLAKPEHMDNDAALDR